MVSPYYFAVFLHYSQTESLDLFNMPLLMPIAIFKIGISDKCNYNYGQKHDICSHSYFLFIYYLQECRARRDIQGQHPPYPHSKILSNHPVYNC